MALIVSCKDENSSECSILLSTEKDNSAIKGNPIICKLLIDDVKDCCKSSLSLSFSVEKGDGVIAYTDSVYNQGVIFDDNQLQFDTLQLDYIPLTLGSQELIFSVNTCSGLISKSVIFDVKLPFLTIQIPDLPESLKIHDENKLRLIVKSNLTNLKLKALFTKGSGKVYFNDELFSDIFNITQEENILTITPSSIGETRIEFIIYNDFGSSEHYIIEFFSV